MQAWILKIEFLGLEKEANNFRVQTSSDNWETALVNVCQFCGGIGVTMGTYEIEQYTPSIEALEGIRIIGDNPFRAKFQVDFTKEDLSEDEIVKARSKPKEEFN